MQTSPKGLAFLEAKENTVLKAYRCPAGRWTIGAGLTAASGVVKPRAGMVITRAEASSLLAAALRHNYEPAVAAAMPSAKQHQFDGGVSFHFNTGAIRKASWVKAWRSRDAARVRSGLLQWVKGGGKVMPGLQRRRQEEADIILVNKWPAEIAAKEAPRLLGFATFAISVTPEEIAEIRKAFRSIGFEPGSTEGKVETACVASFQRRYGLTIDGLIGRATLATLQRELNGRAAAQRGTSAAGASAAAVAAEPVAAQLQLAVDPLFTWIGIGAGVAALCSLAWLAFEYRDLIAARATTRVPRLAAWLWSF